MTTPYRALLIVACIGTATEACGGAPTPIVLETDDGATSLEDAVGDAVSANETGDGATAEGGVTDGSPDSACTTIYYKDEDGDGYGGTLTTTGCAPPAGYVVLTGDCRDDRKDVNPGVKAFTSTGFPSTAPISPTSFDFDCSAKEERDPAIVAARDCAIAGPGCTGDGYLPAPGRAGSGSDPLCGSTRFRKCERRLVPPSCTATETTAPAVGCR